MRAFSCLFGGYDIKYSNNYNDVSDSLRIIQNKHGVVTQKNVNSIYNAMKNAIINGISQKEEFDYKEYNQEINEKLEKLIND